MKYILFYGVLIALFFSSCSNNAGKNSQNTNTEFSNAINDNLHQKDIYGLFLQKKNEVIRKLPTMTSVEADKLYEEYCKENAELIVKIVESESYVLGKYNDDDEDSKNIVRQLGNKLRKYGLTFRESGEGDVEIITKPDFYYTIFKGYVSKDLEDYLSIKKEEDKTAYSADTGLLISFKELGNRIIVWEDFMKKYPKCYKMEDVKEEYKDYQLDYLLGLDNTPTTDRFNPDSIYIYYDNEQEFLHFSKEYPNSPTTKLVQLFLNNFKKDNIRDIIIARQRQL